MTIVRKRKLFAEKNGQWCEAIIELRRKERGLELSICGTEGRVIDVAYDRGDKVYIAESCGQIRDVLSRWFPELRPYFKYHLNSMHAGCPHQRALGWKAEGNIGRECPECGYRYGSAWLHEELPDNVVAWVKGDDGNRQRREL